MCDANPFTLQATGVAMATDQNEPLVGLLLMGASGSGKSSLAARIISDCPWQKSRLIADDVTCLHPTTAGLIASAPARTKGLLELRGLGLVHLPTADGIAVKLVVETSLERPSRLPDGPLTKDIGGQALAMITLNAFHMDAVAKIRLWLSQGAFSG